MARKVRLIALLKKELLQIVRDPSSILIAVILPLILLFLYGSGVSLDLKNLRVGIVMEDSGPDAQSLAQSFLNSRYFDVALAQDRRQVVPEMEKGNLRGFVVIPSYFSEFRRQHGKIAPIQVIADGSETNTANFVQYYAAGAIANWLQQEKIGENQEGLPLIRTEPRFWYNEVLESRYFLLSGALAIIMTLIGTLLTALVVSREWERGTMEALIATPVTIWEIVIGKTVPYFILGMGSMCICVYVSTVLYDLPFRGSFLALFLVSSIFLICSLGMGLFISIISRVQVVASQYAIVAGFLPAYILSGFLFEIASMPFWIQCITYLMPARYFVQSLQTLFLVGNIWPLLFKDMAVMLLMSVVIFSMTAGKVVKRLD